MENLCSGDVEHTCSEKSRSRREGQGTEIRKSESEKEKRGKMGLMGCRRGEVYVHPQRRKGLQRFIDPTDHHARLGGPVLNRAAMHQGDAEVPGQQREADAPEEGEEAVDVDVVDGFEGAVEVEDAGEEEGGEGEGGDGDELVWRRVVSRFPPKVER